jgi:two-component system alkaline phosphatase synthesis response regulator PhoP
MTQKPDDRKRILVVDDDPDTLEYVCELLRINGYAVVSARNANAAVDSVRERVPDMFLIDSMMPETDGMTTLQRCRAEPGAKEVRAVMLTADSRLATLERALSFGFDEFLPKPILDQDGFLQRINDVMTRRRQ